MQKYKLIYKSDQGTKEIVLKGSSENYESAVELCYIDAFTTIYQNLNECIQYLYQNKIITSTNGKLCIIRSKGEVEVHPIFYNDSDIRILSLEVSKKLRQHSKSSLSETKEYKKCAGEIIRFFYDNDKAFEQLKKSFYTSKSFINIFEEYLTYKEHSAYYTPEEIDYREKIRKNLYNILKNYDIIRELKMWINNYQNSSKKTSSSWKNPFEEYERQKEESELRNQNL